MIFAYGRSIFLPSHPLPYNCMHGSLSTLAESLRLCLSQTPRDGEANSLARWGYELALVRLRQLVASGKLHLTSFQIPLEGVAFDCIAELFERDSSGRFPELEEYFSGALSLHRLDDCDLVDNFRALIFTAVADGVFRLYRENDPVLARIIRNVKHAIRSLPQVRELRRLSHTYIFGCDPGDLNMHLPEYPIHLLEAEISGFDGDGRLSTASLVCSVLSALNGQDQYRRFYSVVDIAIIAKRIQVRQQEGVHLHVEPADSLFEQDARTIIDGSWKGAERQLRRRYVDSDKVSEELFSLYSQALERMVHDTFLHNDGSLLTHTQYLQLFKPDLTIVEYRRSHRTHFEYMAKLVKNLVKRDLRELL